jgi:hypothetical protein
MNGKDPFFPIIDNYIINPSYPEQRRIVRQDERPACFYIILSGSALVTYKRITDDHIQTLDLLARGCTFGVRIRSKFLLKKTINLIPGKRNNDKF